MLAVNWSGAGGRKLSNHLYGIGGPAAVQLDDLRDAARGVDATRIHREPGHDYRLANQPRVV